MLYLAYQSYRLSPNITVIANSVMQRFSFAKDSTSPFFADFMILNYTSQFIPTKEK